MAEALSNEDPSLLVVVLDGSELYWKYRHENCFEGQLNYNEVVSNLILFCNAYALMHRLNRLAVLLCRDEEVIQIYPRRSFSDNSSNDDYNSKHGESSNMIVTNGGVGENIIFSHQQDPFIPISHSLPAILAQGLLKEGIITTMAPDIMDNGDNTANITLPPSSENKRSSIANGISKALCIINRQIIITSSKYRYQPRICLFQLGKDNALAYNNIMNSIFSADKLNTPIDAFLLSSDDSHFMQQASFLTHGIYMRPADQTDMLQLLMTHYITSISTRGYMRTPQLTSVDFQPSCFCHRRPVEFAYMCAVCLALTCQPSEVCATCSSTMSTIATNSGTSSSSV